MLARIREWIAPPVFAGDEEKTRVAKLLNAILFIVIGLVTAYAIVSLITEVNPMGAVVEGALLVLPVGLLIILRRGYVRLAGLALSVLLWALITGGTYAYGGLEGSGSSSFFGVCLIAGLLLGGRVAIVFSGLSVLSLGGIMVAEELGIAPPPPDFITPAYRWMELSTTIVGVGALFYLVTRSLENALDRARRNELAAIEASNFKSRLIARISHELRTPLGAILGLSEMLYCSVYGPLSADQLEVAQKVLRNSHRLNRIVAELLDQAAFESGQMRLKREAFAPSGVLARVASTMAPLAESRGLMLTTSVADDVPDLVVGDPERVEQILYHLVDNAVKFTREGYVDIQVSGANGAFWALQVTDTGIGISGETKDFIFEPFRQVDESVTREYSGVGLGLTIVKQFTALMHGSVTVESELGQGSKFTVTLPIEPGREV